LHGSNRGRHSLKTGSSPRARRRNLISCRRPLKNQREQADNHEQSNEKNDADGSADEFQHNALLFARRGVVLPKINEAPPGPRPCPADTGISVENGNSGGKVPARLLAASSGGAFKPTMFQPAMFGPAMFRMAIC
jgi:hypothetical protein